MFNDSMIEKIQKLLNHAEGTDNEAEQVAFIEKAQLLMQQYAIDQETVKAYGDGWHRYHPDHHDSHSEQDTADEW